MAAEKYKTKLLGGPQPIRNLLSKIPKPSHPVTTTVDAQPSTSGMVTVAATSEETKTAIAALLSLGSDVPPTLGDIDDNAALVPLVPVVPDQETVLPDPEALANS